MPLGFESQEVWRAAGRGFQMGVVQPDGVVVHLTGQVAWDKNEGVVGVGDIETQTRKCFENIASLLTVVGGEMSDLVSITTYFTALKQLPMIQQVRCEFLDLDCAPVSTSVMVAGLGHKDFLVELTPVAVVPMSRYQAPR